MGVGTGPGGTVIIDRQDNQKIIFGYEFPSAMTIGGLGIILGDLPDELPGKLYQQFLKIEKRIKDGNAFKWVAVYRHHNVKDNPNADLNDITDTAYAISLNTLNKYAVSTPFGDVLRSSVKKIGEIINSNKAIYFIFNNQLNDAYGLRVVIQDFSPKNTLLKKLNLTELMVFDGNPLAYFDYSKKETTVFNSELRGSLSLRTMESLNGWRDSNGLPVLVGSNMFFTNLNPSWYFGGLGAENNRLTYTAGKLPVNTSLQEFVFWERNKNDDSAWKIQPIVLYGPADLADSIYGHLDLNAPEGFQLTSPFKNGGNPIPYAPLGIDSPRTFAYKMVEQKKVIDLLRMNGDPISNSFIKDIYQNEADVIKRNSPGTSTEVAQTGYYRIPFIYNIPGKPKDITPNLLLNGKDGDEARPFQPGYVHLSSLGYLSEQNGPSSGSPFLVDKVAGVDSLGLLMGALSMAGLPVLDVENNETAKYLDEYYKMSNSAIGLDTNGRPTFFTFGDRKSYLEGKYRWQGLDIERNSVIVPDTKLLKVGDLLVRYLSDGINLEIGVVVHLDFSATTENWREKVYVISVKRGLRQVVLGTWGNPTNSYGGFTDKPEEFQIRRLIKKNPNSNLVAGDKETWDLMTPTMNKLGVKIALNNNKLGSFIPNTGEYLEIPTINLMPMVDENTLPQKVLSANTAIKLIPPQDAYNRFDDSDEYEDPLDDVNNGWDQQNIFNNLGTGLELAVKVNDVYKTLVKYERNPQGDGVAKKNSYSANYNELYFDVSGKPIVGVDLSVDDKGLLTMKINNIVYQNFGVRPLLGSVLPGDDYHLGFALTNATEVVGYDTTNRLAVFDKKMLWRANLYLVEEGENGWDWNDVYKWNAPPIGQNQVRDKDGTLKPVAAVSPWWSPEWGYNEWNWNYDPATNHGRYSVIAGKSSATPENGRYIETFNANPIGAGLPITIGNGGQGVKYLDTTWNSKNNDIVADITIKNRMIYSFGNTTTPFQYGEDTYFVNQALKTYWNGFALVAADMKNRYTNAPMTAIAPKTKMNGIFPSTPNNLAGHWSYYLDSMPSTAAVPRRVPGAKLGGNIHEGFGKTSDIWPMVRSPGDNGIPVGIDCGGFVAMTLAYMGNSYYNTQLNSTIIANQACQMCILLLLIVVTVYHILI